MVTANAFEAVRISEHVYWVGAVDWSIKDFHGYLTRRGSTYNAFLVMAEEPVLVDTVKAPFFDEMLSRVSSVVEPSNIRYIISNHTEMDHSGGLPRAISEIKPEKVFASRIGVEALRAHFHLRDEIIPVSDGQAIRLGGMSFSFFETRMLHWPDSMMTYLADDGVLFSQDGFGMHLASRRIFADEHERSLLEAEGSKYYANILLPYSSLVPKAVRRIEEAGIKIEILAPDHGPLYRKKQDIEWIIGRYLAWADQRFTLKAIVTYDSMWGSTDLMARAVCEGLSEAGLECSLMRLGSCHRSDVVAEALQAGALVVGSPTMNNNIFPTVADLLTYLKGLKPKNLIGASFGSYGWSGEGAKNVGKILEEMGVELVDEPLRVKYVPTGKDLSSCRDLGLAIGKRLKEVVESAR